MRYYFDRIRKPGSGYSKAKQLEILKKNTGNFLNGITSKIESLTGLNLKPYWVSKATFGSVLTDFTPTKTGPGMIGSHKALYDLISNEFDCLVLSKSIQRNFKQLEFNGIKALLINIDRYKLFTRTFSDKSSQVRLFLFSGLTAEQEEVIKNWIETKSTGELPSPVSHEDALQAISSQSPERIGEAISRLNVVRDKKIQSGILDFESKLDEFERMVNDDGIDEDKIRDELHKNIWIVDFKFISNPFIKEKEVVISNGRIDLLVSKGSMETAQSILIELKVPKKGWFKKYRGKASIKSEVGSAISQLIHYIEALRRPYRQIEGIVIIGRENPDEFLRIFNQYLHGIRVMSYTQVISDCRTTINAFKSPIEETPR